VPPLGNNSSIVIQNCVNKVNVKAFGYVAGFIGYTYNGNISIINCTNYGNICITDVTWGFSGASGICASTANLIDNCTNYGNVSGVGNNAGISIVCGQQIKNCTNLGKIGEIDVENKRAAGISVIYSGDGKSVLINNINYGEIIGRNYAGGIIASTEGINHDLSIKMSIINCSNQGNVFSKNSYAGGIMGYKGTICKNNILIIKNSFNAGIISSGINNGAGSTAGSIKTGSNQENYYYELYNVYGTNPLIGTKSSSSYDKGETIQKTNEELKENTFVDLLNNYIENNPNESEISLKRWKYNEGNYPSFE